MYVLHFGIMNLVAVLVEDLVCLEIRMVGRREAFTFTIVHELSCKREPCPGIRANNK
jgi:hypothetical protein